MKYHAFECRFFWQMPSRRLLLATLMANTLFQLNGVFEKNLCFNRHLWSGFSLISRLARFQLRLFLDTEAMCKCLCSSDLDESFRKVSEDLTGWCNSRLQRCLKPMQLRWKIRFELAVVYKERTGTAKLQKRLDPWFCETLSLSSGTCWGAVKSSDMPIVKLIMRQHCIAKALNLKATSQNRLTESRSEKVSFENHSPYCKNWKESNKKFHLNALQ